MLFLRIFSFFKSDLIRHIKRVHEKSKPHKCSMCEIFFSHEGKLNRHIQWIHKTRINTNKICVGILPFFTLV